MLCQGNFSKATFPPRNSRPSLMIRVYENPLVSLNKAGNLTPANTGGKRSFGGGGGYLKFP